MRTLNIRRQHRKRRGLRRHFLAAEDWARSFVDYHPVVAGEQYIGHKLRLPSEVDGPRSRHRSRSHAFRILAQAAENMANSRWKDEYDFYQVAILLQIPGLFFSEVTLFLDADYFAKFCFKNELPCKERPSRIFDVKLPNYLGSECGRVVTDEEYCVRQWTIYSSLSSTQG